MYNNFCTLKLINIFLKFIVWNCNELLKILKKKNIYRYINIYLYVNSMEKLLVETENDIPDAKKSVFKFH